MVFLVELASQVLFLGLLDPNFVCQDCNLKLLIDVDEQLSTENLPDHFAFLEVKEEDCRVPALLDRIGLDAIALRACEVFRHVGCEYESLTSRNVVFTSVHAVYDCRIGQLLLICECGLMQIVYILVENAIFFYFVKVLAMEFDVASICHLFQ